MWGRLRQLVLLRQDCSFDHMPCLLYQYLLTDITSYPVPIDPAKTV